MLPKESQILIEKQVNLSLTGHFVNIKLSRNGDSQPFLL